MLELRPQDAIYRSASKLLRIIIQKEIQIYLIIENIKSTLYGTVRFPVPPKVSGSIPEVSGKSDSQAWKIAKALPRTFRNGTYDSTLPAHVTAHRGDMWQHCAGTCDSTARRHETVRRGGHTNIRKSKGNWQNETQNETPKSKCKGPFTNSKF